MLRTVVASLLAISVVAGQEVSPIAIADLKHEKAVDFGAEVVPIFQRNCLACHNATEAKGDLVLETPASILKGGETGPAVVPGKPSDSLLLKVAAHQTKPFMPPKNNKAQAQALTSDELGLLKLWIAQGATGVVSVLPPLRWQNLAENLNPILACAITPDGQYAACARGNHVDLYELPTLRYLTSLRDPNDRDLIQSLAFSPDGQLLASGSYRAVNLWRYQPPAASVSESREEPKFGAMITNNEVVVTTLPENKETKKLSVAAEFVAISQDGKRLAAAKDAVVRLVNVDDGKVLAELKGDRREHEAAARAERNLNFAKSEAQFRKANVETAEKNQKAETEALKKVTEAKAAAEKTLAERNDASKKAEESRAAAQKAAADAAASVKQATENRELGQKLAEAAEAQAKTASASAVEAEQIFQRARDNRDSAYAEIINASASAKADASKTAEAHAAIDRALVIKLSFEHAQAAKAAAEKASSESAAHAKAAAENKAKAEKTLAEMTAHQKDLDGRLKNAEKQFADASEAAKKADIALKNAETNLEGTTAVAKKANEAVDEAKKLQTAAEDAEKQAASALDAAKKGEVESEKKTLGLAFSGPWLAVSTEGSIRLFSSETGRPGPVLGANTNEVRSLAFSGPTWTLERKIGNGSENSPLADRVLALDFSADGKLLATGGGIPSRGGELKIWNVADGSLAREIKDAHSDTVFSVRFSPDQKHLASGAADKLMKVFEVDTGKFVRSFEGHTHHVLNVSWMRHGRTLASAGADSSIKLWDFASGEQKKTIQGASREITALQFLDSEALAFAASGDNQLRLLKEDGNNARSYNGASDYTEAAAITPDGRFIVAGGNDSNFRIWQGDKTEALKLFPPPAREAKSLATKQAP